jgi:hypothetical protein
MIDTPSKGKTRKIDVKAGEVRWSPAEGTHTSDCISDHPIRIVEVELKHTSPAVASFSASDPLKADPKHYSLVLENNQVRVLRVPLAKGFPQTFADPGKPRHHGACGQAGYIGDLATFKGRVRWNPE